MLSNEDQKTYNRIYNRNSVNIRLNTVERTLLEQDMLNEGWAAASSYIKSKIFTSHPELIFRQKLYRGKPTDLAIALRQALLGLSDDFRYLSYRLDNHGMKPTDVRKLKRSVQDVLELAKLVESRLPVQK